MSGWKWGLGEGDFYLWGKLSYECGVSYLWASFMWGELSWGGLSFVCNSYVSMVI